MVSRAAPTMNRRCTMLIHRCHSSHNTAHEGGNKTHRAREVDGKPWCGTPLTWENAVSDVEVRNRSEATTYIDCLRCLRSIPE